MFGMTPKDSQSLLEDMAVLNTHNQSLDDANRHAADMRRITRERQEDAFSANVAAGVGMAVAAVQIKKKDTQINDLQRELSVEISDGNEMACVARAAVATVKALADKIAELTGEPKPEVLNQAKFIFSKRYDAEIDAALGRSSISEDPRLSGKADERSLYIPGAGSM